MYLIFGWKRGRGLHLKRKIGKSTSPDDAKRKARKWTKEGFRVQICAGKKCSPFR